MERGTISDVLCRKIRAERRVMKKKFRNQMLCYFGNKNILKLANSSNESDITVYSKRKTCNGGGKLDVVDRRFRGCCKSKYPRNASGVQIISGWEGDLVFRPKYRPLIK